MRTRTAMIALYPGPMGAPWCTAWVCGRFGPGREAGPVDLNVSTSEPGRRPKAEAEADGFLRDAGYERTGSWKAVAYSVQAPVRKVRRG